MRFEVKIRHSDQRVPVKFGAVNNISDGGYERGREEGEKIGYENGHKDGVTEGYENGYGKGFADGETEGYGKGQTEGVKAGNQWWVDLIKSKTDMRNIFYNTPIETIPDGVDFSNATLASNMFRQCPNLTHLPLINTTKVTDMNYMLNNTPLLEEVTVDVRSATNISGLVSYSGIKRLNFIGNLGKVTNASAFMQWGKLEEIHAYEDESMTVEIPLDLSKNTSQDIFNYGPIKDFRVVPLCIYTGLVFHVTELTDETMQSVIDGYADLTGQATVTLKIPKVNGEKLTQEQKATLTAKNVTLVY